MSYYDNQDGGLHADCAVAVERALRVWPSIKTSSCQLFMAQINYPDRHSIKSICPYLLRLVVNLLVLGDDATRDSKMATIDDSVQLPHVHACRLC